MSSELESPSTSRTVVAGVARMALALSDVKVARSMSSTHEVGLHTQLESSSDAHVPFFHLQHENYVIPVHSSVTEPQEGSRNEACNHERKFEECRREIRCHCQWSCSRQEAADTLGPH